MNLIPRTHLLAITRKEEEDGIGIHFGGLNDLKQAADKWIKHCKLFIESGSYMASVEFWRKHWLGIDE